MTVWLIPRFESIHFFSAGAGRRERFGRVPFVLIGSAWHNGWRLLSPRLSAVAPSHGQLWKAAVGRRGMHGFVRLAAGLVSAVTAVVVRGGVDAAVIGAPLVEKVWVWIDRVAEKPAAYPLSSRSAVKPALVAVAAGCVAGQRVAAGVAGVLSLALEGH